MKFDDWPEISTVFCEAKDWVSAFFIECLAMRKIDCKNHFRQENKVLKFFKIYRDRCNVKFSAPSPPSIWYLFACVSTSRLDDEPKVGGACMLEEKQARTVITKSQ